MVFGAFGTVAGIGGSIFKEAGSFLGIGGSGQEDKATWEQIKAVASPLQPAASPIQPPLPESGEFWGTPNGDIYARKSNGGVQRVTAAWAEQRRQDVIDLIAYRTAANAARLGTGTTASPKTAGFGLLPAVAILGVILAARHK